jgi:hypothetical protein
MVGHCGPSLHGRESTIRDDACAVVYPQAGSALQKKPKMPKKLSSPRERMHASIPASALGQIQYIYE